MEKKNQNTNKKIIQTSNKQVNQMRDTRTKNASQKRSKKRRKKQPEMVTKPDFKRDCRIIVFMIKYTLSNL